MNNSTNNSYRYFVLAMLTVVYVFNFIDRQLLVILQESIKKDQKTGSPKVGKSGDQEELIVIILPFFPTFCLSDFLSSRLSNFPTTNH